MSPIPTGSWKGLTKVSGGCFFAFGMGARTCIGKSQCIGFSGTQDLLNVNRHQLDGDVQGEAPFALPFFKQLMKDSSFPRFCITSISTCLILRQRCMSTAGKFSLTEGYDSTCVYISSICWIIKLIAISLFVNQTGLNITLRPRKRA